MTWWYFDRMRRELIRNLADFLKIGFYRTNIFKETWREFASRNDNQFNMLNAVVNFTQQRSNRISLQRIWRKFPLRECHGKPSSHSSRFSVSHFQRTLCEWLAELLTKQQSWYPHGMPSRRRARSLLFSLLPFSSHLLLAKLFQSRYWICLVASSSETCRQPYFPRLIPDDGDQRDPPLKAR